MKKLFLSLTLLATTTSIFPNSTDKNISNPISAEYAQLNEFYKIALTNDLFPRSNKFDFDYHIQKCEILIQTLEHKIRTNESGWSSEEVKSALFVMVLVTSTLMCTFYPFLEVNNVFYKLSTGKFGTVDIDYNSISAKLSSLKYTRAQRKKLDRIEITPRIIYTSLYDYRNHPATQWSEAEQKKVLYFARNKALNTTYLEIAVPIGFSFLIGVVPFLFDIIDTVMHHQKYLAEQLTQAKKRYEYLKEKNLEQERLIEAHQLKETYRIAYRAKTLSTVEV